MATMSAPRALLDLPEAVLLKILHLAAQHPNIISLKTTWPKHHPSTPPPNTSFFKLDPHLLGFGTASKEAHALTTKYTHHLATSPSIYIRAIVTDFDFGSNAVDAYIRSLSGSRRAAYAPVEIRMDVTSAQNLDILKMGKWVALRGKCKEVPVAYFFGRVDGSVDLRQRLWDLRAAYFWSEVMVEFYNATECPDGGCLRCLGSERAAVSGWTE